MASDDVGYTEHLHEPDTEPRWGMTWPRFAVLVGLLMIVYWAIL